ncbi:MAG: outer membrane protein assembly factor BamD [Gemmatimonadales bacterium]
MARQIVILALSVAVSGCGATFRPSEYADPLALYNASIERYRHGECQDAELGLQRVSFELAPRDQMQARVRYYLAECRLAARDFLEAARQFRQVADEFPRHELAPDALLRAGDAFAEMWKAPELDPSYGQNAIDVWRELMGRYPESTAGQRARLRVRDLQEMFAEKEYKTGMFYLRLHAYDSAIIYFQEVVAQYQSSQFAPLAVLRLVDVYRRLGYEEEQGQMCNYLRQYYPDRVTDATGCASGAGSP